MPLWKDLWWTEESFDRFNNTVGANMKLDLHRMKMFPRSLEAASESNWIFFGPHNRAMDCGLWHGIMFKYWNLVPPYCRYRCYKVVVKIPTVETLMRFHNFIQGSAQHLETITPLYGKCGIDERWYSDTPYDAFFYCTGLEDGLDRYETVRNLIRTHFTFAPDLPIILKRTCTEFEKAHGPTNGPYFNEPMSPEDVDLFARLNDIYDPQDFEVHQPAWLINKIYLRWIRFANRHGDKSWLNYYSNSDDFLSVKAVTYHHLLDERKNVLSDAQSKPPEKE